MNNGTTIKQHVKISKCKSCSILKFQHGKINAFYERIIPWWRPKISRAIIKTTNEANQQDEQQPKFLELIVESSR